MTERRPFPLTRYFVTTSLVTTLVITGITSLVSFEQIRRDLLLRARNDAVRVIRHLQDDIHEDFIEPTLARGESIDLDRPEQYAALDDVVRRIVDRFDIVNIYLFDNQGTILYSTQRQHVGHRTPADNHLYYQAVAGEIASAVRERGAPLDIAPGAARTSLLETYVPVHSLARDQDAGGTVQNVIEAYQDLDVYQQGILLTQDKIVAYAFSGAAVLFLVLFWIVRRADQFIRERSQALVESNRQLRELSESLEREVQRRSRELVQKEKLASLGTLTAGLAHEVNNPLATIASCAQALKRRLREARDLGELDSGDFASYLDLVEAEAFRVKNLTSSLLDFSRQQMTTEQSHVVPEDVVREALDLLRDRGALAGVDVSFAGADSGGSLWAQRASLRQMVVNITQNAVDAIEDRRRTASPGFRGTLRWTTRRVGDQCELRCTDNGVGLAPELVSSAMEPFFTTKAPGRGTGLGLALCHSIAQRHGGSVEIQSEGVGKGATVTVRLPLSERSKAPSPS